MMSYVASTGPLLLVKLAKALGVLAIWIEASCLVVGIREEDLGVRGHDVLLVFLLFLFEKEERLVAEASITMEAPSTCNGIS